MRALLLFALRIATKIVTMSTLCFDCSTLVGTSINRPLIITTILTTSLSLPPLVRSSSYPSQARVFHRTPHPLFVVVSYASGSYTYVSSSVHPSLPSSLVSVANYMLESPFFVPVPQKEPGTICAWRAPQQRVTTAAPGRRLACLGERSVLHPFELPSYHTPVPSVTFLELP